MSITTLLGKVSDVLTKDFWFASFIPSLVFLSAVTVATASDKTGRCTQDLAAPEVGG